MLALRLRRPKYWRRGKTCDFPLFQAREAQLCGCMSDYGLRDDTVIGDLTTDSNLLQPSSDQARTPFCALNFLFVEWKPPWHRVDCDYSLECYPPRKRHRAGLIWGGLGSSTVFLVSTQDSFKVPRHFWVKAGLLKGEMLTAASCPRKRVWLWRKGHCKGQGPLWSWNPSPSNLALSFYPKLEPFKLFHIWPNKAFLFLISPSFLM